MLNLEGEHLGIPIYLDTNTLLDLLASMEDGFSTASKRITRDNQSEANEISGEGSFGIKAYSLLKLGLKGSVGKKSTDTSENEQEEERFHTYGSLMNRLIKNLYETGVVKLVNDKKSWDSVNESDFIELQGKFIPNPIVNSLMKFNSLFEMITLFGEQKLIPPFNDFNKIPVPQDLSIKEANKFRRAEMKKAEDQLKGFKSIINMINGLIENSENENFQKYVIEVENLQDHKIVSYLFHEFMRDRAGAELPYGKFKIIGKVVRKIEGNEAIDLLEGTVLGLSDEMIDSLKIPLKNMGGKFKIPEIFTEVEAPAMQIIPIAIFV